MFQWGLAGTILCGDHRAVILLGNPYIVSMWLYAVLARARGRKVLFWTHGWLNNERGIQAWVRNRFYNLAHGLLLYGERAKAIGQEKNFPADSLHVIYNSLDYEAQHRVRRALEEAGAARNAPPYFLCIARLTNEVQLELAIAALRILREGTGQDIKLVLIGDGPARKFLEDEARRAGVNVTFVGELYEEKLIGGWIYGARAILSPGKVGLTAMHGLAYGVPVITHNCFDTQMPEYEAIEPGVTGSFFERGDAQSLAKVLMHWLQKPRTPKERAAAVRTIESYYTPDRQVEEIERALSYHLRETDR